MTLEQIKQKAKEQDLIIFILEGTVFFKHKYKNLTLNVGNKHIVVNLDNTLIGTGIKLVGQELIALYELGKQTQELINANPNILKEELW